MAMSADLLNLIEKKTGASIRQLQERPLSEQRQLAEAKLGWPMRLVRCFPFIGRGSVMGDRIATRGEIDAQLTKALR